MPIEIKNSGVDLSEDNREVSSRTLRISASRIQRFLPKTPVAVVLLSALRRQPQRAPRERERERERERDGTKTEALESLLS